MPKRLTYVERAAELRCVGVIALAALASAALPTFANAAQGSTSTVDVSTIDNTCPAGQTSKRIKVTVTATNQAGRSASKSTTITVNCKPPFLRFPDLIFRKNSVSVDECSKHILLDQAAAAANTGKYNVLLVGFRSDAERTAAPSGAPLDYARAVEAAAVLVQCGQVKPPAIKVATAGTAKTPVPTSVACSDSAGTEPMPSDWFSRVELYLVPKNSSYLPEYARHSETLPTGLPQNHACNSTARIGR